MGSMAVGWGSHDQKASVRMGHPMNVWSASNDNEPGSNVLGRSFISSSVLN